MKETSRLERQSAWLVKEWLPVEWDWLAAAVIARSGVEGNAFVLARARLAEEHHLIGLAVASAAWAKTSR